MGQSLPSLSPELDSPNTVMFLFGAPELSAHPELFQELRKIYPNSIMVGCSSAGEIFGDGVFDKSLSIAVAKFQNTKVRSAAIPIAGAVHSFEAGKMLAESLNAKDLTGLFILSDGLCVNGSELIRGVNSVVKNVVVTGGLAGDGSRFQRTWVVQNSTPSSGFVTALAFYGNQVQIGHGSQGGWDIFGPERIVTDSEGNVLYELDGKPALDIYKEYLGEMASGLPATALLFPLQIRSGREDQRKLVRTILSVDESKKAMVFAGDIPKGSLAQLMKANFDRLIDGAACAAQDTGPKLQRGDRTLALAISCVGRRLVLGERTEEEVEATLERLPPGAHQIGFYSYGEISPYVNGNACELHNQTMTLTTISEKEAA
jgi:hypothetical protein